MENNDFVQLVEFYSDARRHSGFSFIRARAPPELCLDSASSVAATAKFFNSLYFSQNISKMPVLVDLSDLLYISSTAALMLFANITRIRLNANRKDHVRIRAPLNQIGKRHYASCGVSLALSSSIRKIDFLIRSRSHYSTSVNPRQHYRATCSHVKKYFSVRRKIIFQMVEEATLNVKEHAYPSNGERDITHGRFWQYFNVEKNQIRLAIYDMGIGIPNSIRRSFFFRHNLSDQVNLELAFRERISTSNIPGRGRGKPLSAINKIITTNANTDQLVATSGSGRFVLAEGKTRALTMPATIVGTLLEWSFENYFPAMRRKA